MIPIMALWTAVLAALTTVKALSVVPAADRTEVVIEVDGPVAVKDYLLQNPTRLVIDMAGAQHGLARERFTGINRGGVTAVRTSQFQPEVVRVVVELAQPVSYQVDRGSSAIRVSFPNPAGAFEPWYSGEPVAATTAPPPAAAREPEPASRGARKAQGQPITVHFQETPILDVLATFAEFAGRSIVAGADMKQTITADIREQPWDLALDAILQAQGLAAVELESGIIRVDALDKLREREKNEELVTRQFPIKYVSVDTLAAAIKGLLSERGKITTSYSTNTMIVSDGRSVLERLEPMIGQLDARTPQVTIAAKIIFVDRTALEEFGVVYDLKDSRGNQINTRVPGFLDQDGDGVLEREEQTDENVVLLGGSSIAALANANFPVPSPTLQVVTSLVLGRYSLITFIDALQSLQFTDIQAAPVLMTLDHREAYVQVGSETPIRVVDASSAGGAGAIAKASVEIKQTGVILRVTPHVTGNQVLLELHAENSRPSIAAGDVGVTFETQESETQVLLNDGETAVISGLTIIEKAKDRTGIPFLMDLPLIGALFRHSRDQERKQDLLIMVTPHIVRDGGS